MLNCAASVDTRVVCSACGEDEHQLLGQKDGCELAECSRCGTVFLRAGSSGNLKELYDHYYDRESFGIHESARFSMERLAVSFEQFRQTSRWLDVGYGEGGLLSIAESRGWRCYGTELSPQALDYGRRRGWVVGDNAEDGQRFPDGGFDIVTMVEFLEHVPQPQRYLRHAARWLRPGGLLYITTPNAESLNRRLLGLGWSIFSPPEHMTIWTAGGLRVALASAGFDDQRVRTEGLNPTEILARLRPRNSSRKPVDRNATGFAINNAFSKSPVRRAVKASINRCLSAFRAGDTLKVWAVRA